MNTPIATQADEPRTLTHVLYALHTITWFSGGIFSVVAIVIRRPSSGASAGDTSTIDGTWRLGISSRCTGAQGAMSWKTSSSSSS